jgi:DNA-binding response OmpR family regulator
LKTTVKELQEKLIMKKELDILLVEDDFEIGSWLKKRISELENINSLHWESNLSGAKNAIYNNPDIVILDLKLPDGNGIEILRTIKEEKLTTKVYVFSVNSELKKICLRLGADQFFDKSTDIEKLIEILN